MNIGWVPRSLFATLPNCFTSARLFAIPSLCFLYILKLPKLIALGLAVCFLSDLLDGLLARLLNQTSESGALLDSLTDHVLLPSALVWFVPLEGSTLAGQELLLTVATCLYVTAIVVGIIRRKKFGGAHLLSSTVMCVVGYLFLIGAFYGARVPVMFYAAIGAWLYFSAETTIYSFWSKLLDNGLRSGFLGLTGKDIRSKFVRVFIE
jgi:phosphatidylglycerophosphate synthase